MTAGAGVNCLRTSSKGLLVVCHILTGLLLGLYLAIAAALGARREPVVRWWHRRLLRIMDVTVRVQGELPNDAGLVVGNHVSWLDIPVIGSVMECHFVSKAEVAQWPLIGGLARIGGTEFHQRGGGGARRLIERLVRRLVAEQRIVIFPEGTTTEGTAVRRFQPRLFAAAIEAEQGITPVVLRYGPHPAQATDAPYIGDDVFFAHLWRLLRHRAITVDLTCLPVLSPEEVSASDRNTLAARCQTDIAAVIAARPPVLEPVRRPAVFASQRREA